MHDSRLEHTVDINVKLPVFDSAPSLFYFDDYATLLCAFLKCLYTNQQSFIFKQAFHDDNRVSGDGHHRAPCRDCHM